MKKMLLVPAIALSSILTSATGLEWSQLNVTPPVAGKDTGTGVYVRKRNTGYTDTYSNFFGGSVDGSYWEGKYNGYDPKYMREFQGLSYDGTWSRLISKLTIRSEGWSTLESNDSRWEGHYYSAMMPTGDGGQYTLHATNKCVGGGCEKETNNPYVYVKNGDTLIIGNGGANTGLVFDWKSVGYQNETTLDTDVGIDVRGSLLSNITLQQEGTQPGKSVLTMKVTGNGSYKGLVDVRTNTSGFIEKLHVHDYAYKFDDLWEGRNGAKKRDYHRVELSANGDQDVEGYKAEFLLRGTSSTLFHLTGQYRGGRFLEIHAENGARYAVKTDTKPVTIGTLSVGDNSIGVVSNLVNLTIDNLAFGTWDKSIGVISGGETRNAYIGIESRANLTINAFRGNSPANGSNPSVVELKDMSGVAYFIKPNMEGVNWKLGVNNNTTLNLYGTKNILSDVYGVGGNKHLNINVLSNDKTIIGMETLRNDVLNSNGMKITTTARGRNKSDIFYINRLETPIDGSAGAATGTISLIPTIQSEQDRKSVIGAIVGYTPKTAPGFVKEFTWNPNNGILNKGFKIVLGTFNQGNNHTGWKIDQYILLGVDDKENIDFDPDDGFNCGPGYECGELDPEMGKPDVDNDAGFNPGLEPDLDKPEPPKPEPEPEPEPTPPDPGPGEGEKPDPTPPEGGDGNGGTKPPTEGGDNGGTKPPVTPPEGGDNGNGGTKPPEPEKPVEPDQPVDPDPKPEVPGEKPDPDPNPGPGEGGEDKPKPPVQNESVFTETFKQTVAGRVQRTKSLFLVNFNSINKRLGDLRSNDHEHGVWTRGFVGGHDNGTFYTIQAGYDNQMLKTDAYSFYLGAAASYSRDDVTNMGEIAMYMSYIQDNGWYNDTIVKFAMMNSKSVVNDFMHYGVVFSDEIGYRFNINGWFIDPQVELSLGYLTGADFKDVYRNPANGASSVVNASFTDSLHFRARFGASTGYNHVFEDKGIKLQAYAGLFGEVDKFTQSKGKVGAYGYEEIYGAAYTDDIRMVMNIGTNVDFRDNGRLYVDFEKSFFGDFNINWKVNLGYRYSFGKKEVTVDEVIREDKKEDITPVKLKDEIAKTEEKVKEKVATKKQPAKTKGKVASKKQAKKTASTKKASNKKVATKKVEKPKVETKKVASADVEKKKKKSDGWFLK